MAAAHEMTTHVRRAGARPHHRPGAQVLGRADAYTWCEVTVQVGRTASLPEPEAGQATLRSAEWVERPGADARDLEPVAHGLMSQGLTVIATDAATRTVQVAGSAAVIEQVCGVHLLCITHHGLLSRGRAGDVCLPCALADIVTGVCG